MGRLLRGSELNADESVIKTASLICSSTPGAREKRCQRLSASRLIAGAGGPHGKQQRNGLSDEGGGVSRAVAAWNWIARRSRRCWRTALAVRMGGGEEGIKEDWSLWR